MEFFLTEILARLVGAFMAFDCVHMIWAGLRDGKIRAFQTSFLNIWPNWEIDRQEWPVMFWIQIGIQAFFFFPCLLIAILGWNLPRL